MKKKILAIIVLCFLIILDTIVIADNLMPIYLRNREQNTILNFTFNVTTNRNCDDVLLTFNRRLPTDNKGTAFALINITNLTTTPSFLCEYEENVLKAVHNWNRKTFVGDELIFNSTTIDNLESNVLNINSDIRANGKRILLDDTFSNPFIQYNTTFIGGTFLFGDLETDVSVEIGTMADLEIVSNIGADGNGAYTPSINLNANGDLTLLANDNADDKIFLIAGDNIQFRPDGDTTDFIIFETKNDIPIINTVGNSDLRLNSTSGIIDISVNATAQYINGIKTTINETGNKSTIVIEQNCSISGDNCVLTNQTCDEFNDGGEFCRSAQYPSWFQCWGEESGGLSTTQAGGIQFSMGNGDLDIYGCIAPCNGEVVTFAMQCQVSASTDGKVTLIKNGGVVNGGTDSLAVLTTTGVSHQVIYNDSVGFSFDAWDVIGFKTIATDVSEIGCVPQFYARCYAKT